MAPLSASTIQKPTIREFALRAKVILREHLRAGLELFRPNGFSSDPIKRTSERLNGIVVDGAIGLGSRHADPRACGYSNSRWWKNVGIRSTVETSTWEVQPW